MPRRNQEQNYEHKNNLSIFLLKPEYTEFEEVVEDENYLTLPIEGENTIAYYKQSESFPPSWLDKFFGISNFNGLQQSNSRVLLLKKVLVAENENRIFAIVFGYGKTLLKEDVIEEQFGLKVVLNSIETNKIRKISKVNIGKNSKASQEQMPKESSNMNLNLMKIEI